MARSFETRQVRVGDGVALAVDLFPPSPSGLAHPPGFLLVHGLASNARLYDGVAERLSDAGHLAAAVDLRGHGRSDKPESGYDYDTMCRDLALVVEALFGRPVPGRFERPVLVGQSFGGNLVLEVAARYPDLTSGVACIDGGTIDLGSRYSTWGEVSSALAPPPIAGRRLAELEQRFFEMHPDWPAAGIKATLANFEVSPDGTVAPRLSLEHHLEILRTMWESSTTALYEKVRVPVLLLPAESPSTPAALAASKRDGTDEALSALEVARVHWFSPADHDVHAQHPDQVAAVLLRAAEDFFSPCP